ncbi:MAG: oxidoreductase [Bacteroidota bacterium]|nr:oxidoreductase [Bacteroidota bacterium]
MNARKTLATVWLSGCTGCHMSLLDCDEKLLELPARADIVYSPFADIKSFPAEVDITLVEGAVSTDADIALLHTVRKHTRTLVAFGDCAVSGNITAMRNAAGLDAVLARGFGVRGHEMGKQSGDGIPVLIDTVIPLHRLVDVDVFLPSCPPSPELIWYVLNELLSGRQPEMDREKLRYG